MAVIGKKKNTKRNKRKATFFKNEADASHYRELIEQLPLLPITDNKTNELALEVLGALGDKLEAGKATKAEIGYYKVLLNLVSEYERRYRFEKLEPRELLKAIMEFRSLRQEDLASEFGGQARVSQFLNGKRDLSINQIRKLSERFKVSPSAFIQ